MTNSFSSPSLLNDWSKKISSFLLDSSFINGKVLSDPFLWASTTFALSVVIPTTYFQMKSALERLSLQLNNPEIRKKRSLLHEKFSPSKLPDSEEGEGEIDYLIIGSGMSGLSCGAILSRLGRKVVVLEQHYDVAGGGTHMFDLKGYPFDSGLHYTVPWSLPLFALTCLKKPKDCIPFEKIWEDPLNKGTIDRLFFTSPSHSQDQLIEMKYQESHLKALYEQFPEEKDGLDAFMSYSEDAMAFVKIFFILRLFPKWIQNIYWHYFASSRLLKVAGTTAKELLPKLIKNPKLISILSSMWIDTGARPDLATFVMTASVFRGISMEGGVYPKGGSEELAKELVTVIESTGGKVLIRSDVEEILFDPSIQRVNGVKLRNGPTIHCTRGVVSSTGYHNTMNNLISKDLANQFGVLRSLPIPQSAGFVMANIGINCSSEFIGATSANTWHIPLTESGDIFQPLEDYFSDPLAKDSPISAFITFPSIKDSKFHEKNPSKTSCQILLLADYQWFYKYLPKEAQDDLQKNSYATFIGNDRLKGEYEKLKKMWEEKCLAIFLKYYPKAEGFIDCFDISTPLTIEYYLRATHGGAVGLDCCPERYINPMIRDHTDPITLIPGLALTGQDTAICGVTLAQLTGVITAFRLEGYCAAFKILFQSIILGN